jgi:hypothetical protein
MDQIKALYAAYKEMRIRIDAADAWLERFRRRIDRAAVRAARGR